MRFEKLRINKSLMLKKREKLGVHPKCCLFLISNGYAKEKANITSCVFSSRRKGKKREGGRVG